jgi:hypothetical protein
MADISAFMPGYERALAWRSLDHPDRAAAEFRTILEHPGWGPTAVFLPLARLGLARSLAQLGDRAGALREYDALLEAWRHADADLPVLLDAKRERAALAAR